MKIHVDIVTPTRRVLSQPANAVTLPSWKGEMGILPEHAAMVSTLGTGVVRITNQGKPAAVAIRGGFLQVLHNRVTLVADEAVMKDEVDAKLLEIQKSTIESKLVEANVGVEEREQVLIERDWVYAKAAL